MRKRHKKEEEVTGLFCAGSFFFMVSTLNVHFLLDNSFVILSIHSSCAPLQVLLDSTEQTFYLSHNKTPLKCLIKLLVVCFLLTKKLVVILSFYLWIDVFSQSIYRFYVVRHKCRTFYWKTSIDDPENKKRAIFLDLHQE